ncbi:MAG: glycosyltransferase family 87 protein [bacterium]
MKEISLKSIYLNKQAMWGIACIISFFIMSRLCIIYFAALQGSDLVMYTQFANFEYLNELKKSGFDDSQIPINIYQKLQRAHQIITHSYPVLCQQWIKLIGLLKIKYLERSPIIVYRSIACVADVSILIAILMIVWKKVAPRNIKALGQTAITYTLFGVILAPVLYDRVDIFLIALVVIATVLLLQNKPWMAGWIFGIAVLFKLVPIILWPLFLLMLAKWHTPKTQIIKMACAQSALLGLFLCLISALSYWHYGLEAFSFVTFHSQRGIQIESTWSTLLWVLQKCGHTVNVVIAYGCAQSQSALSPVLSTLSSYLIGIILSVYYAFRLKIKIMCKSQDKDLINMQEKDNKSLVFFTSVTLILAIAMACSKVLSTQYFIWLIPFLAIILPRLSKIHYGLWTCILVLTTAIFPFYYFSDIAASSAGPSPFGLSLLIVRNSLLVAATVALFVHNMKQLKRESNK